MDTSTPISCWRCNWLSHAHVKEQTTIERSKFLSDQSRNFVIHLVNPYLKKAIKMIWIMVAIVVASCHLMPVKRDTSYILTAILLTITRVLYATSISWMILASHSAHGGHFAQFLNHPIFVHINKLSYGIYLVNPVVISAVYGWQNHSTHVNPVSMVCSDWPI